MAPMFPSRSALRLGRRAVAALLGAVAWLAPATGLVAPAAAHGVAPGEPPSVVNLLLGWHVEPAIALPLLATAAAWAWAVRRVDAAHPANPVPRVRSAAFYGGLAAIALALMSGIERYDTTLFSIHMIQHILLMLVAAPLLALSGPITLLLRLASPDTRRRWVLPFLHSRIIRALTFPVVAWILFAGVLWATHFSPVFNASLEDPLIHDAEHVAYLATALLFWWPAVGPDPSPWRMSHPVRALYVFLQMPQNTFLAVALLSAPGVLYPHYATLVRAWGPDPLLDQQIAAGIMWLFGDLLFLAAVFGLVAAWMRHDERRTVLDDRRADAELAAIRAREVRLEASIEDGRPTGADGP